MLLIATCFNVQSQGTVVSLTDSTKIYELDGYASVLIDSIGNLSFEQLQDSAIQKKFSPSGKRSLTFGYLDKPIWIKLSMKNLANDATWYLSIPAPYLAFLRYYYFKSNRWGNINCGYYLPHHLRGIPDTGFTFPVYFTAASEATVYVCITGISPKNVPLLVLTPEKFMEDSRAKDIWYGFFFGAMIVMMLYNLILAIRLKDTNYLIYVGTIICTLLVFGSASGYTGKYLWPNTPEMNFYAGRLSLSVLMFLVALFTTRFLETKYYANVMHMVLMLVMAFAIISFFLVATSVFPSAINNLTSFATPIFLISGIVCWRQGNRNAKYFVAAWSVYLMGGLSATLRNSGLLPANFWTTHLAELGAACETFLIAIALSARYSRLIKENEEAQLQLIEQLQKNHQLQQQATTLLENKVMERTREIQQQNEKLTKLNLLKDKLFSIVSHDIKTPLSQLSGTLYLVERDMISKDEIKELMPQIRRNLVNNENFLAELLAWTRNQLEGGKINLNYFNLKVASDDIVALISPQAEVKKVKLTNSVPNTVTVYADVGMIKTVMRNLLVNAVKFTDEGGTIDISVNISNEFTTVFIADSGVGIDPEKQKNLFTMSVESTQGTANEKGTGLGLLICKDFVASNGGRIWVESEAHKGSKFIFTIPNHPPKKS
jgi:signal transduction histidine kinase